MEAANKKLIIFDFDGVFNLDSMPAYYYVYDEALSEEQIVIQPEEQREIIDFYWGNSHREILQALIDHFCSEQEITPDPELHSKLVKTYETILMDEFPEIIKPVPGAAQMLGRLASKYTLALNTSADPEVLLERVMPKVGIQPHFFEGGMLMALDFLDDESAKPKPHPYPTRRIMAENKAEPHETIMVGDSDADIRSAIEAGIEDIVVPLTGRLTYDEAREWGVEIIPSVTDLEKLLKGARIAIEDYQREPITNGY